MGTANPQARGAGGSGTLASDDVADCQSPTPQLPLGPALPELVEAVVHGLLSEVLVVDAQRGERPASQWAAGGSGGAGNPGGTPL